MQRHDFIHEIVLLCLERSILSRKEDHDAVRFNFEDVWGNRLQSAEDWLERGVVRLAGVRNEALKIWLLGMQLVPSGWKSIKTCADECKCTTQIDFEQRRQCVGGTCLCRLWYRVQRSLVPDSQWVSWIRFVILQGVWSWVRHSWSCCQVSSFIPHCDIWLH